MVGESIKQRARDLGFAACGVCEARPSDYEHELREWLGDGRHGEMAWLAERIEVRVDPGKLVEGAESIIVVADALPAGPPLPPSDQPIGQIARYAQVPDYHKTIKKRLHQLADELNAAHPDHTFRSCVDTAPILEREHAQRAGIGWVGKHTLTLGETLGSHMLLGEIVTTLPIEPDAPATDHCGTCTRCIDACPTNAITAPRQLDATRCISYLTIEHRSAIDPSFYSAIGEWVYGCDICQDVCPHVQKAEERCDASDHQTIGGHIRSGLALGDVIEWTEADRRAAFVKSAMKRAKLDMMKRNALIAAGNFLREREHASLRRQVESAATDPENSQMVRQTAREVLARLVSEDR